MRPFVSRSQPSVVAFGKTPAAVVLLFLAACGSSETTSLPTSSPPSSAPVEPTPATEPPITECGEPSPAGPPLTWSWSGPALGPEVLAAPPAETVDPGGLTCAFSFAGRPRTSTLSCTERSGGRRWGFDVVDGTTAATLLRHGETLVAARFDRAGFGVVVECFEFVEGSRHWARTLTGLPVPIGGLAVQAIELTREELGDAGQIVVRGWDAGGRWAVALDEDTGEVLRGDVFEGSGDPSGEEGDDISLRMLDIDWRWEGPELMERSRVASVPEVAVRAGGTRCRWLAEPNGPSSDDDRSHLECLDARGRRVWGFDEASPWPEMQGRALAIEGDTLYVLAFHRAATGASMTAYEVATGVERWTRALEGIGAIDHSGYMAWAQLRILDGRPVAFGWEAEGRYIEAFDPATGTQLFHRLLSE